MVFCKAVNILKTSRFRLGILVTLLTAMSAVSLGQNTVIQQEQLEQARQREKLRHLRLQPRPDSPITGIESFVPAESAVSQGPSFLIRQVQLDMDHAAFPFLYPYAQACENKRMNLTDIQQLANTMNEVLLNRGYATSRVMIPEQNLADGILHLVVQTGRIRAVRYGEGSAKLPWRTAFPSREGDILNVHLMEQGIEQMKRLSSQDVHLRLVPAEEPGQTDIELAIQRTQPVHGVLSVDDSGLPRTGRIQLSADISIDNPFYGNDYLQIGLNGDGMRSGHERGTRMRRIYYRIPSGKDTFSLSYSSSRYHQTVHNIPTDFISSGKSNSSTLSWEHLMSRSQHQKTILDVSIHKRNAHYYINDLEIAVQALHTTALGVGVSQTVYDGQDVWYGRLGYRMGVGWLGAMPENPYKDGPKTRYHMWLWDIEYRHPFRMGNRPAAYTSSMHGQWTMHGERLYGVDMLSIGNRYTVRGFDGEMTLMAENGWYWRQELSSRIDAWHSDVYFGIDIGAVYGPAVEDLVGRTLIGAVLGMRGQFASGITYDAFIGMPLYKPDGHRTGRVTTGAAVSWRF